MADPHSYTPTEIVDNRLASLEHRIELMDGELGDVRAENRRLKAKLDEQAESE